jgi:beta-lactamase regulating signal transducer with metallopeptidase domain
MIEQAIAEYIVNALWQVPLLAGGAWLLLRMVRPDPRMQHGVWLAVLGLAVLLPLRGMRTASISAAQPQETIVVTSERTETREVPLRREKTGFTHTMRLSATATRWLVRLYLATVVFTLLRIARSWHAARHLVAHAQATSLHGEELALYSRRFGVKLPQLRQSADVSSPMVLGVSAPVLLLPEGFARFSEDEVAAALCHELAHIKRQDYLMNLVCQVVASPLAWHPVVDEVQQRIRMTREMICDAMAAQEMKSHIGYARCLLALAHSMLGERAMAEQAQFPGLFTRHTLEERVMRLMETTTMSMRARVVRAASGAALMIASGSLAAMFHVTPTMAESRAGAPPQATQATSQTPSAVTVPAPPAPPKPVQQKHKGHTVGGKNHDQKTGQQIEDLERDVAKARAMSESPEFQHRMEEAQRQMAKAKEMLDSPVFKQRMEDAQRQMAKAKEMFDSPEYRQRMEDAQRQMEKAKEMFDSPEYRQQMEDAQRQMAKAKEMFDSPEFKRQMDELREQSGAWKRRAEEDNRKLNQPSSPTQPAPTN